MLTAVQIVLPNYIHVAVDSKFSPTLWAKPPDLLFPYTNNGAESYHSHLNAEFYVKHPSIYVFVDVLKKIQHEQHVTTGTEVHLLGARENSVCGVCPLRRRKYVIVMEGEPNCDSALRVDLFSCDFFNAIYTLLSCGFIHYSNAFSSSINAFVVKGQTVKIFYALPFEPVVRSRSILGLGLPSSADGNCE